MSDKINIDEKFSLFSEHWRPKVVAELNGQEFKLAKIKGEYPWHAHEDEDEMFFVWKGALELDFRDGSIIRLEEGEAYVIPKGVEHRPRAEDECQIFLIEPANTKNSGNATVDAIYDAPNGVRI